MTKIRPIANVVCALIAIAVVFVPPSIQGVAFAQDNQDGDVQQDNKAARQGHLIQIPLPITSQNSAQVRRTIERLLENSPAVVRDLPVIVLEFDTSNGQTGKGSELEDCMRLARFLTGPELTGVKTVAYIPAPKGFDAGAGGSPASQLNGHAVLVALAANEISMHPDSTIGKANIDEPHVDDLIRELYRSTAAHRLVIPVKLALSMVDPEAEVFRAVTNTSVEYVNLAELEKMEAEGDVDARTLSPAGEVASFTCEQLEEFGMVRNPARSRSELARRFELPPHSLDGDPTLGREWKPVLVELPSYADEKSVQWIMRSLDTSDANLIMVKINASGGDPDACWRLAERFGSYDPNEIRTVAFVSGVARGPAALVALTCDHLIMSPNAELMGASDPSVDEEFIVEIKQLVKDLAHSKGRDWSIFMASLDPSLDVTRYREKATGQIRLLCKDEHDSLADGDQWLPLGPLPTRDGIGANLAEQLFLARTLADDIDAVSNFYQLESTPPLLQPSKTDQWLENVAIALASPFIAPWLLFAAVFFISSEMSAPGIGVPGFLGTLCLILFFWSQHLDGNAHWLEIMLFVTGVIFIIMELFVIPGFGVFGIGGFLMVVASIILASQTFIIPTTSEELSQLPRSLMPLVGAGLGFVVAVVVLHRVLPHMPYFKRMMLEPPSRNTVVGVEKDPESVVDWGHLEGKKGETMTRLFPAGKARIAGSVYDVISDGRMIDKGEEILVASVSGNRIVVRPLS